MLKSYINWKPQERSAELLAAVQSILDRSGVGPTMGQLHHLVAERGLVERDRKGYRRVHTIVQSARLAGVIDWDALSEAPTTYAVPGPYLDASGHSFEVWVSSDAFVPQVREVVQRWGGRVVVLRGYASTLSVHEYAQRVEHQESAIPVLVLTDGGDSGEALYDSVVSRIAEMAGEEAGDGVHHVAPDEGGLESMDPENLAEEVGVFAQASTGDTRPERFAVVPMQTKTAPLVAAINAAMATTGETTRAASLKAKIKAAIEEHGA